MPPDPTKIVANGQEMVLDLKGRLHVMVPDQGITIDVPDAVEISYDTTRRTMAGMSERAWTHISTGELFPHLFKTIFPALPLPATVKELNAGDPGVVHVCGLIVQLCECLFAGKPRIYLRHPEHGMHPATSQRFMLMVQETYKLITGTDPWKEKP